MRFLDEGRIDMYLNWKTTVLLALACLPGRSVMLADDQSDDASFRVSVGQSAHDLHKLFKQHNITETRRSVSALPGRKWIFFSMNTALVLGIEYDIQQNIIDRMVLIVESKVPGKHGTWVDISCCSWTPGSISVSLPIKESELDRKSHKGQGKRPE